MPYACLCEGRGGQGRARGWVKGGDGRKGGKGRRKEKEIRGSEEGEKEGEGSLQGMTTLWDPPLCSFPHNNTSSPESRAPVLALPGPGDPQLVSSDHHQGLDLSPH